MKRGLMVMVCLVFLVSFVSATNHYVSPSGSASWSLCTNINTPCSLSTANSNAVAGDTVILRDGAYTITIAPSHNGTSGSPITYKAENQYDAVSNTNSYGAKLTGNNYITIDGIYFSHAGSYWLHFTNSDYNTVQNCKFYNSDSYGGTMIGTGSSYNRFLNNVFMDAPLNSNYVYWDRECQDAWDAQAAMPSDCDRETAPGNLLSIYSGYGNLIEGNTFGRCSHDAIELFTHYSVGGGDSSDGGKTVVRDNVVEQTLHSSITASLGHWGLFENNIIKNGGTENEQEPEVRDRGKSSNPAFYIMTSDNPPASIIRKNIIYNTGIMYYFGGKITGDPSSEQKFYYNTGYNNNWGITFSDNGHSDKCYYNNIIKNNIFFYDGSFTDFGYPGSSEWCSLHNRLDVINTGDACINTNYFDHNIFPSNADQFFFKDECSTAKTLTQVESQYPTEWFGNLEGNPLFTNAANHDFTLQSNSPAIDAGDWLSTITSSTSSGKTSFTVADAKYFYDGWGIPGETGDVIKTEHGQTTTIQSIDYNTNTLTVSPAISIVNGEGLALDYSGTKPDIGAIEYTGTTTTYECSDNIDNDNDGQTDYPNDSGCSSSTDNDESDCGDGVCESAAGETSGSCLQDCPAETADYTILKTSSPPTIDGNLNEFTNANPITIINSNGNSLIYKMLWDSNNLYIAAQGSDSQLAALNTTRDGALWNDDAIELFFDTLNNGGATLQSDDYKFFVNLLNTQKDSNAFSSSWNTVFSSYVTTTGTLNVAGNVDAGYTIEVAIPWTDWATPSDNDVWGFDVSMDDRNDAGNVIQKAWSQTNVGNIPDEFGDVTFSSQFVLPGSICNSLADANSDGVISISELINYISQWKAGSVTIGNLIDAIGKWKSGC